MGRRFGVIVLGFVCCLLASAGKADIDPAEYELESSLRSERERKQLRIELEKDQAKELEMRRAEAERESRRIAEERAAWEALPYPVRLTRTRCAACHATGNYEQQRHNRIGWELVILRMQYLNDAKLGPGERTTIAAHLAAAYPATGTKAVQEALEQLAVVLGPAGMTLGGRRLRGRLAQRRDRR